MRRGRAGTVSVGRVPWNGWNKLKGLLSSCKGQVEIGQHEFTLVYLVLPLAVFWDFGSRKGERTVATWVLKTVTLNLVCLGGNY